jgi:hypothetical protein
MSEPFLPPDILAKGPIIIGATGGSGTRVVAKIIRDAGVYQGKQFNRAGDSVQVGRPAAAWINDYMTCELNGTPPPVDEMLEDLQPILQNHVSPVEDDPQKWRKWGWKSPRSIYLLPFYHAAMPAMQFIHVVRDGRDMAFSTNQHQLRDHGDVVLRDLPANTSAPVRAMALWSRINLRAAEFCERVLPERYLVVRFEDLCFEPATIVDKLLRFVGGEGDAAAIAAREVAPPSSIGRWKTQHRHVVDELQRAGESALRKFRYLD